jgi:hypothetical protein
MAARGEDGLTLAELLLAVALAATIAAVTLPILTDALDTQRTASAARYLAGRVSLARMEAVMRSTMVGIRFEGAGDDYTFATYVDGNANGIRTLDIRRGIDLPLTATERLADNFRDVVLGLLPGVPDADGGGADDSDGVRIGAAKILSLGANGTATAGTLYLHGRKQQFAVRIFGVTARTRVLQYRFAERKWVER